MSIKINIDDLSDAIDEYLKTYSDAVITGIKKQTRTSAFKLKRLTVAASPTGHRAKHYKSTISVKKLTETSTHVSYLWYAKEYTLSHLLENPHKVHNGGYYRGSHFIKQSLDPVLEEYEEAVDRIIKNGG